MLLIFRTGSDRSNLCRVTVLLPVVLLYGGTSTPASGQDVPLVKPPPVPTGVVILPQAPPSTGQQSPLPAPAVLADLSGRAIRRSPLLSEILPAAGASPLTMDQAVSVALATSKPLASARESLERAAGRTDEVRSATRPTAGVGVNLTEFDAPTVAKFGASSIPITNQFNPAVNATVNLPIDLSGMLHTAVTQAQFQEVAARIDINRVRNQTVLDVKTAFYNALRAQAQVDVSAETLRNSLSRLSTAQKSYAAGLAPRFDVITAQTDAAAAQQGLIQARSQVSLGLAQLKSVMGVDVRSPLRITGAGAVEVPSEVAPAVPPAGTAPAPANSGDLPAVIPDERLTGSPLAQGSSLLETATVVEDTLGLEPRLSELVTEALSTRAEVFEANANIAAAAKGVLLARRSTLPTVGVGVGYTLAPNAAGFSRVNQLAATLSINMPLLDGGLASARTRQARAEAASAETNLRQVTDTVTLEVQQAYLALLQARDRVAVANVGVTQAREAYRLAQVRYAAGVSQTTGISPQLELSNTVASLAQAAANQVSALYDYNSARAQLDRAIGRYSYTSTGGGYSAPPGAQITGATVH